MGSPDGWEVHPDGVLDLIVPVPALCAHWENLKSMSRRAQLDSGHRQCGGPSARINRVALSGSDCGLKVAASLLLGSSRRSTARDRPCAQRESGPGGRHRRRTAISPAAPAILDSGGAIPLEGNTAAIPEAEGTRRPACLGEPMPCNCPPSRAQAGTRLTSQAACLHRRVNTVPASSSNEAKRAAQ